VLTPKFGKGSDLWVQLGEESVWRKERIFQVYSEKKSVVGYLLPFGKGTVVSGTALGVPLNNGEYLT
jgi:hypothetical protein